MGEVTLREIDQRFDEVKRQLSDFEKHLAAQREADMTALRLQAAEYERRLDVLNHAHEEARAVQAVTVTRERFDDYTRTEQEKRELALQRVDEKFQDYVKRYEQRQREVDLLLSAQEGAAREAKEAAEKQGRMAVAAAEEAGRRSNRNIALVTIVLTIIIAGAQFWGTQDTGQQINEIPPVTTTTTP